jgi:Xaa-Pro aminopeptidase
MGDAKIPDMTGIPERELASRRERIQAELAKKEARGGIFFSPQSLQYITGFHFIATERPMAVIIKDTGELFAFVPYLEHEYVEKNVGGITRIFSYPEYPGPKHPMLRLAEVLAETGLGNSGVCADSDGYGAYFGYSGPALSSLCPDMQLIRAPELVPHLKRIKSPFDISAIREVTRWAHLAHTLLHEYTRPGMREVELVRQVTAEATRVMLRDLGPDFNPGFNVQATAYFRGQVGADSYYPHARCGNAVLKKGDMAGTSARAPLFGYESEMERILFLGEPTTEMRTYYAHCLALQEIAFSVMRPGRPASAVDAELYRYYEERGLVTYWRHHTGHALGFAVHEAPFLDRGDETLLEPGMVFSVEPGIYVKGLGGFRLSDTVLITEQGIERITYYPREIEKVIIL